jgi:transcriptional regulator with XRE-family HTH domain
MGPITEMWVGKHWQPRVPLTRIGSGEQIREARRLLGITQKQLAKAARLHFNSVRYWEKVATIRIYRYREPYAVRKMREAFQTAGIVFLDGRMLQNIEKNGGIMTPASLRAPARGLGSYDPAIILGDCGAGRGRGQGTLAE